MMMKIPELLNESDDEQRDIPLQERKYNPNHNAEKIHLGGVKTLYYLDDVMHICERMGCMSIEMSCINLIALS